MDLFIYLKHNNSTTSFQKCYSLCTPLLFFLLMMMKLNAITPHFLQRNEKIEKSNVNKDKTFSRSSACSLVD